MDFAPSIAESEDFELNANPTIPQESVRFNTNIQSIESQDEKVGQDIEMGDVFQGISQALDRPYDIDEDLDTDSVVGPHATPATSVFDFDRAPLAAPSNFMVEAINETVDVVAGTLKRQLSDLVADAVGKAMSISSSHLGPNGSTLQQVIRLQGELEEKTAQIDVLEDELDDAYTEMTSLKDKLLLDLEKDFEQKKVELFDLMEKRFVNVRDPMLMIVGTICRRGDVFSLPSSCK